MKLSRRQLLKAAIGAGALTAVGLGRIPQAKAAITGNPTGVLPGAIRWDPWYGSIHESDGERDLGWGDWQFRAPWFAKTFGKQLITINGANHQEILDLECQIAAAAGIKYWMWDWYANSLTDFTPGPGSGGMLNSWLLYQTSAFKNLIDWCFMMGISSLGFNRFQNYTAQMIIYMSQSNYFTVLGGRPVMYIFVDAKATPANGYPSGWSTVATQIAGLRTAASGAGIGNPYVVLMDFSPSDAFANYTTAGADAISSYTNFTWGNYAGLVTSTENLWTSYGATGAPFIPFAVMGADVRPRLQWPPAFDNPIPPPYQSMNETATPGTLAQKQQHAQNCINYVANNPTQCPANAIITYAWTECDEGGSCLIPTLGDPPQGNAPYTTNILGALSQVFHPMGSSKLLISNAPSSFLIQTGSKLLIHN